MQALNTAQLVKDYERDGYVSGIRLLQDTDAKHHRDALESAEQTQGKLHYMAKIHTIFQSPFELATLPSALDIVEQLIGPDILLYNVTYIIKEAGAASHVSWHQDLTYWGLKQCIATRPNRNRCR